MITFIKLMKETACATIIIPVSCFKMHPSIQSPFHKRNIKVECKAPTIAFMLLLDMMLCILRQNAQIWFNPLKLIIVVHNPKKAATADSQIYILKLHLCNTQQVQTWQGEKDFSSTCLSWQWAKPGLARSDGLGQDSPHRCQVKEGEGVLFGDEWIWHNSLETVLTAYENRCPSTSL